MSERRPPDDPRRDPEDDQDDDRRFTVSLAGLAVAIFLVVVGYWVLDKLAAESKLEDCMMAGRRNCEPLDTSTR